jgi:hypothetical protein
MLSLSSSLRIKAECSSETSASAHKSTNFHNPEGHNNNTHRSENLTTYTALYFIRKESWMQKFHLSNATDMSDPYIKCCYDFRRVQSLIVDKICSRKCGVTSNGMISILTFMKIHQLIQKLFGGQTPTYAYDHAIRLSSVINKSKWEPDFNLPFIYRGLVNQYKDDSWKLCLLVLTSRHGETYFKHDVRDRTHFVCVIISRCSVAELHILAETFLCRKTLFFLNIIYNMKRHQHVVLW